MSGIQARAAATLGGNPVDAGFPLGVGAELGGGGGVGSTGSGITTLRGTLGPLVKATPKPALFAFEPPRQAIRLTAGPLLGRNSQIHDANCDSSRPSELRSAGRFGA